jgi:hypothetical protein
MSLALSCWGLQMERPKYKNPLDEILKPKRPPKTFI